ncbi:hypothetical protein PM082_022612 [Marasmius tenuissimus]|nr:hypothetical protein PM082_022612 [Marasmius tenuissimus]
MAGVEDNGAGHMETKPTTIMVTFPPCPVKAEEEETPIFRRKDRLIEILLRIRHDHPGGDIPGRGSTVSSSMLYNIVSRHRSAELKGAVARDAIGARVVPNQSKVCVQRTSSHELKTGGDRSMA